MARKDKQMLAAEAFVTACERALASADNLSHLGLEPLETHANALGASLRKLVSFEYPQSSERESEEFGRELAKAGTLLGLVLKYSEDLNAH